MKKILLLVLIIIGFLSCKSSKIKSLNKDLNSIINSSFYDNQFTGVFIYNPETKDTLYKLNSEKYFTPASNTKIFTLYAALKTLPDSIPALKYNIVNDTLFIEGTGDPTFLHPYFNDSTTLKLVSNYKKVGLYLNNFDDEHFAPGWAWEDYDTYFSPERSGFPMYGNVVEVSNKNNLKVTPSYLKGNVSIDLTSQKRRVYNDNVFYYNRTKDTLEIPMVIDSTLIKNLWNDIAPNKVSLVNRIPKKDKRVLYSIPSDSLYKRMMVISDNFLAEQMLMLTSSALSDTLNSAKARKHILSNHLKKMKHQPRWVDGSGLSRYNLFTPESLVYVLNEMYEEVPRERLFNLFPVGGVSVTLDNWYGNESKPYVYAKSGTLGNNYSLSGYLITKSGKTLVFSFLNNHYRIRTSDVRKNLQRALETIRDNY